MTANVDRRIGRLATLLLLNDSKAGQVVQDQIDQLGWRSCTGKVGSMDSHKVVAAIETTAKKNGIIQTGVYREAHALYHAILEALSGVTRGQVQIGSVLRTVGLSFSIIRGNPYDNTAEGDWIAVCLYGTIGAPIKGSEHETLGLGINHM